MRTRAPYPPAFVRDKTIAPPPRYGLAVLRIALAVLMIVTAQACSSGARPGSLPLDASGADAVADLGSFDVGRRVDVVPVDPCGRGPCGPTELCGAATADGGLGPGNGVDDNCDGRVDENCACTPGEMRACFDGAADRRGVGACRDGVARCSELAAWIGNECVGAVLPTAEVCNGRDDDCNGAIDDGLEGCATTLRCPASEGATPLLEFTLDGRAIDAAGTSFAWSVRCPDGVAPCPAPTGSDGRLHVTVPRAGTYGVTMVSTHPDGTSSTCSFPLYAQGLGLRVELDWDRKGGLGGPGADMDLHVALIDRHRAASTAWFTPGDCYFQTCRAPGGTVQWGVNAQDTRFAPSTTSAACQDFPAPNGDVWRASGRCWNPRLDVDDIVCDPSVRDGRDTRFCFPENQTVDDPPDDATFRIGVNFYEDHGLCADGDAADDVVHPVLTVSCGGIIRADVGSVDDGLVGMRCADNPTRGSENWTWIAADVRFSSNACGLRDCKVTPLFSTPGRFTQCSRADANADVCQDAAGRVFVRNSGGRAVDVELAESP